MENIEEHHAAEAYAYPLLIKQLLHTPLLQTPHQEIVYRDQSRYDYRKFRQRIGRLADGLSFLQVRPGHTVAIMDWDSHRYLECYFAVPMMGAVLQTINIRLSHEQIAYTLNHAAADVLLLHVDFLDILTRIKPSLTSVRTIVLIKDGKCLNADVIRLQQLPGEYEYEALLAAADPTFDFPELDENTRATTFYTTGTTGLPKGVFFTHRQIVLHTIATMAGYGGTGDGQNFHRRDVYMPITPMFHVHAWGLPYVATLMGVKQVYPGRYEANELVELMGREKVTFSHCVPTILNMVLNSNAAAKADFNKWKVVIGGSALPKGLARQALDAGIDVFAAYGMSETCPMVSVAQLKEDVHGNTHTALEMRCKTGRPIPLVDLRIIDLEGREVAHDGRATGEIVLRAPWLTQGYYKNPQAAADLWQGGYLHTQDMGNIDANGYLQITDRLKDVIKSGGEWISSIEIENILSQHPSIVECAVFGVRHDKWGEVPMALVIPRKGATITQLEINQHFDEFVRAGLVTKYCTPHRVEIVTEIEKTSVGKINKKLLREKYR